MKQGVAELVDQRLNRLSRCDIGSYGDLLVQEIAGAPVLDEMSRRANRTGHNQRMRKEAAEILCARAA